MPYARGAYPRPAYRGGYNPALALDAADGVIDGRYFGAPIAGRPAPWGMTAPTYVATAPYAAAPYAAAPYAAAPYTAAPFAGPGAAALALDAADGVIDGRYFGSPVVGAAAHYAPTYVPGAPFAPGPYWGAPGPVAMAPAVHPYGYNFAPPVAAPFAPALAAPNAGAALALDAADGVIDGRYHGAPIGVQAAPAVTAYQPAVVGQPTLVAGNTSSALALDAADGRIDGKYFGANIATAAPQYAPAAYAPAAYAPNANAARALDAADGVIDGRYYGNRIVHS